MGPIPGPARDLVVTTSVTWAKRLWAGFIWPYRHYWIAGIAILSMIAWVSTWAGPIFHRKITIYTSTPNADATRFGKAIDNGFRIPDDHAPWFISYHFEVKPTEGLGANRELVNAAKPGELVIGFDQDGFNPPDKIRTLMPLNDVYLHIFANVEELKPRMEARQAVAGALGMIDPPKPLTMSELIAALSVRDIARGKADKNKSERPPIQAYFGPAGSGSRLIAVSVMRYYGIPMEECEIKGITDWDAAYDKLTKKEIDFIFAADDLGSDSIARHARKGKYTLVSLDHPEALAESGQNTFRAQRILKGSYTSNPTFCPGDISTISTRRIIICPAGMSQTNAFYLTGGIREALRQVVPVVAWNKEELKKPADGLILPLHPGADDFRKDRLPWWYRILVDNWLLTLTSVGVAFGFFAHQTRANRPPIIILERSEVTVPPNTMIGPLVFGIGDAETKEDSLKLDWETDRPELFPRRDVVLTHTGRDCTIRLMPANNAQGSAKVIIKVADAEGLTTSVSFTIHFREEPVTSTALAVIEPQPIVVNDRPKLPPKLDVLLWDFTELERKLQDGAEDGAALRTEAKKLRAALRKLKGELPVEFAKDLDDARAKLDQLEGTIRVRAAKTAEKT